MTIRTGRRSRWLPWMVLVLASVLLVGSVVFVASGLGQSRSPVGAYRAVPGGQPPASPGPDGRTRSGPGRMMGDSPSSMMDATPGDMMDGGVWRDGDCRSGRRNG